MFCGGCGLKSEGNDAFCMGCGASSKSNQGLKRSSRTPIIIAVACVVVVLLGVFIMNGISSRNPLIGTWDRDDDFVMTGAHTPISLTFDRDGSLEWVSHLDGSTFHFTYRIVGNTMVLYYDGFYEGEFQFSVSGNQLRKYSGLETRIFTRRR